MSNGDTKIDKYFVIDAAVALEAVDVAAFCSRSWLRGRTELGVQ